MPVYDRVCVNDACDYFTDFALERYDAPDPPCPRCGSETRRVWLKFPGVIADTFTTPLVDDVMDAEPQTFESRSEHRRAMKARGLINAVRHAPPPDSDKSKHTTRWT